MIKAAILLEFETTDIAEIVAASVERENEGYVNMRMNGTRIEASAEADNLMSLLHTIDDFLACTALAHKTATLRKR